MTEHDIRRAHALWLHLKQAYTDLGAMHVRWEGAEVAPADEYEACLQRGREECAAELRAYLAKWKKPVEEGEP